MMMRYRISHTHSGGFISFQKYTQVLSFLFGCTIPTILEWFFSRRVKFDSGLNVMAVYEASRHGPKIVSSLQRHPEERHEVGGRGPFWFSKKVNITLLELVDAVSKWMFSVPDLLQGFDSSICDWKFGKYHLFLIESFRVDFRCVHRF